MAQRDRRALVVGNGVIGLSTAICLQRQKFAVVIVTSDRRSWKDVVVNDELAKQPSASAVAGGWWFPSASFGAEPADKVDRWALRNLEVLRQQMTDKTSSFSGVVEETPSAIAEKPETPLPRWSAVESHKNMHGFRSLSGFQAARELEKHFGSGSHAQDLPAAFGPCTWFMKCVVADSPRYAMLLEEEFLAQGGEICYGESLDSHASVVARAERVGAVCIANCAGSSAAKLSGAEPEDAIVKGRGVLSVWRRPKTPDGAAYLPECSVVKCMFDGRTTDGKYEVNSTDVAYVIPRGDIVACGGCVRLGDETSVVSNLEKDRLLSNAKTLMPRLVEANPGGPLFSIVSWRPIRRKGILCEVDAAFQTKGTTKVWANNYGHGGGGWTLFWACAEELAEAIAKKVPLASELSSSLSNNRRSAL
eukprot:TRINITY_DN82109_c0_g1_i1.p1 TRINITY_DN82109_c0_g1~~TRINITY_DN82109_c0_g1_i1.p1  ORF type:complete len:419 (-),score=45.44 TRINITY_DN82109_c0_g1_i1:391-1647(-)